MLPGRISPEGFWAESKTAINQSTNSSTNQLRSLSLPLFLFRSKVLDLFIKNCSNWLGFEYHAAISNGTASSNQHNFIYNSILYAMPGSPHNVSYQPP